MTKRNKCINDIDCKRIIMLNKFLRKKEFASENCFFCELINIIIIFFISKHHGNFYGYITIPYMTVNNKYLFKF